RGPPPAPPPGQAPRRAARRRSARRLAGGRPRQAHVARAADGETPHVRSVTVRTTPATHDVLPHEAVVLPAGAMPDPADELHAAPEEGDPEGADPVLADTDDDEPRPVEADDGLVGADPVRLYLKQMGQASLLSREGEVEIAKRIEEGERHELSTALGTPLGLR